MDAYWNHFFHAKDLAPRPAPREGEPVAYPDNTPVLDLLAVAEDPDPPFGLMDGVTPEELARARIAKHKELLTPPEEAPPVLATNQVAGAVAGLDIRLLQIREELALIRDSLPGGGHP